MKKAKFMSAIACAAFCLSLGFSTTAKADDNSDIVRTAQMRLASVGFYVGRYDGKMGPMTETAILDFQRSNGLAETGQLTPETYTMLTRANYTAYPMHYAMYPGVDGYYHPTYAMPVASVTWDYRWHYQHTQEIPNRFARLDVNEDDRGSMRHYAVTLNGTAILVANNQPNVLRVSRTFEMNHEDAVIISAYQGDDNCAYKNYLLTIHSDGTYAQPRQIGNCSGNFEAHVADNALFVSFPGTDLINNWRTWDTYHYQDGMLNHT